MREIRDEKIRESIETVEPAEGARDRMLDGIRSKAGNEKRTETKKISVNRIMKWAVPVAACLALVLVGTTVVLPKIMNNNNTEPVSGIPGETGAVQIANPNVYVDSAEDFAAALGFVIDAPEGSEDVSYTIIADSIAEVEFTYDSGRYCYRASKTETDLSGLYGEEIKSEEIDPDTGAVLQVIRDGELDFLSVTWTADGTTFNLANTDGISEDEIKAVYEAVK